MDALAEFATEIYLRWLSPAACSVPGPAYRRITPRRLEVRGEGELAVKIVAMATARIEAAILSASQPPDWDPWRELVPLDLGLAWRGLAEPLGRLARGQAEQWYLDDGQRLLTLENERRLTGRLWCHVHLVYAPSCPPIPPEACKRGRVVALDGYLVDLLHDSGNWLTDTVPGNEGCETVYVTAWSFSRWWGWTQRDRMETSAHALATQSLQ